MKSIDFLKKMRVRSGLQLTTCVVSQHPKPYVYVDFFYDRDRSLFAIRLCWLAHSKTVYLASGDVFSKSKSQWMTDKTYALTDECINRLAPGLDSTIAAVLAKLTEEK